MKFRAAAAYIVTPTEDWKDEFVKVGSFELAVVDGKIEFLSLNWEYVLDGDKLWLFTLNDGKLYRLRLYFQSSLETVVGDLRHRLEEGDYELLALLRSESRPKEIDVDVCSLEDPIFVYAWEETSTKKYSEKLTHLIKNNEEKLQKDTKHPSQTPKTLKTLESVLNELNLGDYIQKFEKIELEDLCYLDKQDLRTLIPTIADRVKLEKYIKNGNK
jgi:hypothetical protein